MNIQNIDKKSSFIVRIFYIINTLRLSTIIILFKPVVRVKL